MGAAEGLPDGRKAGKVTRRSRTPTRILLLVSLLPSFAEAQPPQPAAAPAKAELWAPERPWEVIDLAIALDTSQSMQGLIDTTRLQLWEIVNDLHRAEPKPTLRVALLTFGNAGNDPRTGWVSVESDLTEDLDLVSERLFSLTSDGGTEFVARVLQMALQGLSWTASDDALKLLFVAGNEPADQDPEVSFREMSDLARRQGIFVQSVFCGSAGKPDSGTWKELAELAAGGFASVDHRTRRAPSGSPFDNELVALSAAVNDTYLPLGDEGRERLRNRRTQDLKVQQASVAAAASRALTKSTLMESASWDLVAAVDADEALLYEIEESRLPESIRGMDFEERRLYVEEMRLERERLRERIVELAAARREFVAAQRAVDEGGDAPTFDALVRRSIREKAEEKGFLFPDR